MTAVTSRRDGISSGSNPFDLAGTSGTGSRKEWS